MTGICEGSGYKNIGWCPMCGLTFDEDPIPEHNREIFPWEEGYID